METQHCSKCQTLKPITEFGKNAVGPCGRHYWCRACTNYSSRESQRRIRATTPSKRPRENIQVAEGFAFCSRCQCTKPTKAFGANRNRKSGLNWYCKSCANRVQIERRPSRYGLSPEDMASLESRAGGMCEICRKRKGTHIDHDHTTGFVRGLLCRQCNTSLGQFGDSTVGLQQAMNYLLYAGDNQIGVGADDIPKRKRSSFRHDYSRIVLVAAPVR